jgi:hypothetical protein
MKKITLLAVAFVAVSFASCKKDRVCTCTSGGTADKVTYLKARKSDARAACLSYKTEYVNSFTGATITEEVTCNLN